EKREDVPRDGSRISRAKQPEEKARDCEVEERIQHVERLPHRAGRHDRDAERTEEPVLRGDVPEEPSALADGLGWADDGAPVMHHRVGVERRRADAREREREARYAPTYPGT